MYCRFCGAQHGVGSIYCPECGNCIDDICGQKVTCNDIVKYCGNCGAELGKDCAYCPSCGNTTKKVSVIIKPCEL